MDVQPPNLPSSTRAMSCVLQRDALKPNRERGKDFSLPGTKHFKRTLNRLIFFFNLPHSTSSDVYQTFFASLSTSPLSRLPVRTAIVHPRAPWASPKGSHNTEGYHRASLRGLQQTLPCTSVWDARKATTMLGQIKSPVAPRAGLQYDPGFIDVVSCVPTKALTLELSVTTFLLSINVHAPHLHTHIECNTCQGCILGSHACHLIRSPFNFILSFIWWNASRGQNYLHVTNIVYTSYLDCFWQA